MKTKRAPGCVEWLLELADSIITYRSRYMAQPELLPAVDLIVLDEANPHAVIFQMHNLVRYQARLERELANLSGEANDDTLRSGLARLRAFDLQCIESRDVNNCQKCGSCDDLADLLADISNDAANLSDRLAMRFFTHVGDVGRQTLAA
jgi:uncharacterized alpha-E superfamily protein